MGRIPDRLIQDVLDKTDIVSIIGDYVRLTKKGGRWVGLCPFHSEKSPSFNVDPDKGLYYCFGCQKGGSAVQFLMEMDKLSFPEAMEELAKKAGIALEVEDAPSDEEKERRALFELYERLRGTFHWLLTENASGSGARERLRARGLPDSIIEEFVLGYAPADKQWMHHFLLGKGYSSGFLARSGLFAGSSHDFPIFADRLMFPISDAKSRVIAFGGRLLEGDGPKYINSPDTPLFRKQDNLFALDRALPTIKKQGEALICEGYMDALSFHAAGITMAVAPLGTSFTANQARLLKRWADRVLLCFDSDEAGKKAAERGCAIAAGAGLDSLVVSLPGGKDASEILEKEGIGTLQKTRDFTINGGDFLVKRAKEFFDIGTVEGKAKASAFLYPYADALTSEVKRGAFLDLASRELGANPISIRADYEAAKRGVKSRASREAIRPSVEQGRTGAGSARTDDLVFMAAAALNADRFEDIRSAIKPEDLDDFRARDIFIALEEGFRADDLGVESVLARVEDESVRLFVREVSARGEFAVNAARFLSDGTAMVRRRSLERRRERLLSRIADIGRGSSVADAEALNDLLYEKKSLDAEWEAMKGERDERP
ncbi:MAG: DNA primase [Rectinemataceae bacterium]|jgi:DNA primase